MTVYYNENDPQCAAWLQSLMDAEAIPRGDIDTRSIEDVTPNDVRGYTQCHFFAGIGGWAYALDLAGWPRSRPVWTGSCPCQPFSAAGKGAGFEDERHLWPAWQHLIAQCRPPVVFGEQVAHKRADPWIDLVHADLEGLGYAFGCVPFPAAGVGAPHIRDRAYWLADADLSNQNRWASGGQQSICHESRGDSSRMEHASRYGRQERRAESGWRSALIRCGTDGIRRPIESGIEPLAHGIPARMEKLRGYGNAIVPQAAAAFVGSYLASASGMAEELAA